MKNRLPLIDEHGEVRELAAEDFSEFKPAHEVLPTSLKKKLGVRGPQKKPTKELISIRLSADVLEAFRSKGDGWQGKIEQVLRASLKKTSTKTLVKKTVSKDAELKKLDVISAMSARKKVSKSPRQGATRSN